MKKKLLFFILVITIAQNAHTMQKHETMCIKASHYLQKFEELKAQPLPSLKGNDNHDLYTRNKIINDRSPQLRKVQNACNENKTDSVINEWKDLKLLAKSTLTTAEYLTQLLQKKSNT